MSQGPDSFCGQVQDRSGAQLGQSSSLLQLTAAEKAIILGESLKAILDSKNKKKLISQAFDKDSNGRSDLSCSHRSGRHSRGHIF